MKSFSRVLICLALAGCLVAPASVLAVDLWEAHSGDPCCGIPPENYKYLDANEACNAEVVTVTDECNVNPQNIRNDAGPQAPGACFHDLTCICDVCAVGSPPYTRSVFSGKFTGKRVQTCPPDQTLSLGLCQFDPPKSKGDCADCNMQWSNPVFIASGNKHQREAVYRAASGGLELVLNYNSQPGVSYFAAGPFGRGWSSAYFVRVRATGQGIAAVQRPDGKELEFRQPASGNAYLGDADVNDRLDRVLDSSGTQLLGWLLTSTDGDQVEEHDGAWSFLRGHVGTLVRIRDRSLAERFTMTYSTASTPASIAPRPNLLIAVADKFGRQLNFTYDAKNRVVTMTDPVHLRLRLWS